MLVGPVATQHWSAQNYPSYIYSVPRLVWSAWNTLTREYMHSAAILDRRVVDIPDAENAPAELAAGTRNFLATGYRAVTIMPMMRGDVAIGALSVARHAPGPASVR